MTPDDGGYAARLGDDSEPRVVEATLDELGQVYGADGVQRMYEMGALTAKQARAWERLQPQPPAFGTPVPEAS